MSEIIVRHVFQNFVTLLIDEPGVFKPHLRKEILKLKDDLDAISTVLKDADEQASDNYSVKSWVKDINEVAYLLEDAIDGYMLYVAQHRKQHKLLSSFHLFGGEVLKGNEVALQIQKMRELVDRGQYFRFSSSGAEGPSDSLSSVESRLTEDSLFIEETELVGIESSRDQLISLLLMKEGASKPKVISVVGVGGVGKTTLVQTVYCSPTAKGSFECYAWINVSHSYKLKDVLCVMILQLGMAGKESAPSDMEFMEVALLMKTLWEYLQRKRYLVVFDDVWNTDFLESIQYALPDDNNGSRVIITTRNSMVASSCQTSFDNYVFWMEPLSEEEAWKLFCMKAFPYYLGGQCPPELRELSLRIVRKCRGLPILTILVGGLLSTQEKTISQWQKIYKDFEKAGERSMLDTGILPFFSLSYNVLPYNLKSCFLYLGIFPTNYSINCSRLIKLWIAEGFVEKKISMTLEEVAEEYLSELLRRCLVEVTETNYCGKPKNVRVHDLVGDFISFKSMELSFSHVLIDNEHSWVSRRVRRLSIQYNKQGNMPRNIMHSLIRSVFLFKVDSFPIIFFTEFRDEFKFLKLLDFQDAPLKYVPKEVTSFLHLIYLSFRGTNIKELPRSIGKLNNLQTLDLKFTLVSELPPQIKKLLKLRHLLVSNPFGGVKIEEGVGHLEALQKLYYVEADHGVELIRELGKLRQLRKLGIKKLRTEHCGDLCSSIEKMNHLQSFYVHALSEDEIIDLQDISSPPRYLRHICLEGRLSKLPNWIAALHNLARLHLTSSRLIEDPLTILKDLPDLLWLGLYHAYDGEQLYFESEGFKKLKMLELTNLKELSMLKVDEGALPLLEKLTIGHSLELKEVPSGIQHLKNLTTLTFVDMPKPFVHSMLPDEGRAYSKVEHISTVLFKQKTNGAYQHTYSLSNPEKLKQSYN